MLKSNASRWGAGAGLLCAVMVLATWFLLISPRRSEAADLRDQTANRAQLNDQLRLDIEKLRSQFADLPRQQAVLAAIKLEMPELRAQGDLVRRFDDLAESSGVKLSSYSQGAAVLATAGGAPGATPVPGAAAATPSGTQVFQVPTTLSFSGDYFSAARFVKKLQTEMTRAFLISSLNISTDSGGDGSGGSAADGDVTISLSGTFFVLRTGGSMAAPVVPSPTSTPTPTPSVTGTPTATPTGTATPSGSSTPTPTTTP